MTLVTNDNYAVGALTLAASLKRVKTTKKLAIMITNTISDNIKKTLDEVFDDVISVEAMDSGDLANLTLLERTELGITFTKVRETAQNIPRGGSLISRPSATRY